MKLAALYSARKSLQNSCTAKLQLFYSILEAKQLLNSSCSGMQKRCAAFEALGSSFAAQLLTFKCCELAAVVAAVVFFVLTSGRPLPVTHSLSFRDNGSVIFCTAAKDRHCLSLSKGFPLQPQTPKTCYWCSQHFYRSFVALLEVILQRCSFRTG